MTTIGRRRVEIMPTHNNSPGENKNGEFGDDKQFGDSVPHEDTGRHDDALDTQVVDFDDETQPVDFDDETQIMDLAGETQIMDDYSLFEDMDTQQLDVSDSETECNDDGEDAERTEVMDDTVGLSDIQFPDINGYQTTAHVEKKHSQCHQGEGEAPSELLPSDDGAQSSGSMRTGLTSIRTASLRAAGIAAGEMASKDADNVSCSFKLHSSNDGQAVDLTSDRAEHDEKGLCIGDKSNVARSLARELFMGEDAAEKGSVDNLSDQKECFSQLPGCDNELAGLSYVDSQEPGELSQANALDFVDRFLKVNVLESDQDVIRRKAVSEVVTPAAMTKGANSVAQQATHRNILEHSSIFDWDNKLEDDGGGEFFIKTKEVLFGNSCKVQKSCRKQLSSKTVELRSLSLGKIRNAEGQQNVHDTIKGFLHSDPKLLKATKIGLDTCGGPALEAQLNAQQADVLNVGIDTQIAAEAMEALSTATALVAADRSMADQGKKSSRARSKRETTKNVISKQSSVQKRACPQKSGVVTRSRRTEDIIMKSAEYSRCSPRLRSRSQHVTKEFKVDLLKPEAKRKRLSLNNTSAVSGRELSDIGRGNVEDLETQSISGGELINNRSPPVLIQSLPAKVSTLQKTRKHVSLNRLNGAGDASDDSKEKRHCLDVVHNGKGQSITDITSGRANAMVETLNMNTVVDTIMIDGLSDRGRDLQHTVTLDEENGEEGKTLRTYGGNEDVFGSVARRTRSRRRAQRAQHGQDEQTLHSSAMLSSDKTCHLPAGKQDAYCHSAKEALVAAKLTGSPKVKQKSCSKADITPENLKTPGTAVSPICIGDKYHSPSCKKKLSLTKEFYRLTESEDKSISPSRILRQKRDLNSVRVLFSQHLDEDIVRQQKKILSRLGISEASSILEATHFVADMFVRTRNMLEAIANSKLVVTHLWLESCGQASCLIDEKKYILRDTKKEKELGFSMPMSFSLASSHPLLEGRRIFITSNVKPSKEIVLSLVKAVHGQAVERLCRSMSNYKLLDDLLVLSCEEDFEVCVPLLEKEIAVYSSELLLNGIITQRLEYDRYRLFADHVKKTRSTLWLKKDGDRFLRVAKTK